MFHDALVSFAERRAVFMEIHELQQLLSEMSLQEKIGQMVQLTGAYFDKEAVLTGVVGEQLPPEWIIQYAGYLKSEDALIKLLSFVAMVCVLIAAFGIFSLVTLSCEQRRKEIAVRKVNGATIRDILIMFVKAYMLLLVIAGVIAFPVGYVLMQRWLENYVEQTTINAWIYLVIAGGIAIIIFACIGWRVWQAARQNPAEVIKSE